MNEVNSSFSHFRLISSRKLFMGKASMKPNDVLLSDLLTDVQSGAALSLVLKDAKLLRFKRNSKTTYYLKYVALL